MKFSFHEAADLYYAMHKGHWHHDEDEPSPELVLRSREMETIPLEICSKLLPLNPTTQSVLDTWMASGDTANYETCKFARAELSRWLSVNRLASVYPFAKNATSQSQERNGSRPVEKSLSKRERTSLLNIVGAMLAQLTAGKDNDTTVITQAVIDFGTKDGISERKLQQVFAEAKRSLGAS
jgi:hypothetical protein